MGLRFTSVHYSVGESIEMCCEREIHEEVGVGFTSAHYSVGGSIEMSCGCEIH